MFLFILLLHTEPGRQCGRSGFRLYCLPLSSIRDFSPPCGPSLYKNTQYIGCPEKEFRGWCWQVLILEHSGPNFVLDERLLAVCSFFVQKYISYVLWYSIGCPKTEFRGWFWQVRILEHSGPNFVLNPSPRKHLKVGQMRQAWLISLPSKSGW